MKDFFIPIDDDTIFCQVSGKGKPLLLLHGNEENHEIFAKQQAFFMKSYQVIALDSRGHGRSEHGKGRLTFEKMSNDIIGVLDYFKLAKVDIIGFSDGGNLGLYIASYFPERVKNLVIVGANYRPEGLNKVDFLQVKIVVYYLTLLGFFSKAKRQRKEVIDLMWHQITLTDRDLKRIKANTLIIAGEHDVVRVEHTKKMHDLIVKSKRVTIPKASHFLMVEQPEVFNTLVSDFLSKKNEGVNT